MPDNPRPRFAAALFVYYWLCSGFFLGTLTLMGPVRWVASYARNAGWGYGAEKAAVFALIAALLAVSLPAASFIHARAAAAADRRLRAGLPAGAAALFLVSLWFWMNPELMIDPAAKTARESYSWSEFVFGPYPEAERLARLKAEGYTAVVSLLSQAVVPFEPVLLSREREAARAAGIELIHIPMLPWVSSNDHVAARLKELERRGPGKYYVHCYLGKDRVNVFKGMLASAAGGARLKPLQPENARRLGDIGRFERGAITRLSKDVFFTPYPTDEEFFGYILNGTVKSVASLLDPVNPEDLPWIEKEKAIAAKYGLKLASHPWKALDKAGKAAAVREIKALEKPLVIHAFLPHAPECAEFMALYKGAGGAVSPAARPASEGK